MRGRVIFLLVFMIISVDAALGATIYGKVFDYDLKPAQNAIIKIDTIPSQMMVCQEGHYSFVVGKGEYSLSAVFKDAETGNNYSIQEKISIIDDGDYLRDLVLFPQENLDELAMDDDLGQIVDFQDRELDQKRYSRSLFWAFAIGIGVIVLAIASWKLLFNGRKGKSKSEKKHPDENDELEDILSFIRKHKRVTQKELRKEFLFSEAKISLMLADLESCGMIKKIKKGRGNIIIYEGK